MSKRKPNPAQLAFDFTPPVPWTTERLCEVLTAHGITVNPYVLSINSGVLHDPDAKSYCPRSLSFPVCVEVSEGELRLWLRTPAGGTIPFVGRVESMLGVRAVWDEDRPQTMDARWHHAVDLLTAGRWQELLETRAHTGDRMIVRGLQLALEWGALKPTEARQVLSALGIEEPSDRSEAVLFGPTGLRPCRSVGSPNLHVTEPHQGWAMVHAIEDGWVSIVKKHAKVTAAYWKRTETRIAA